SSEQEVHDLVAYLLAPGGSRDGPPRPGSAEVRRGPASGTSSPTSRRSLIQAARLAQALLLGLGGRALGLGGGGRLGRRARLVLARVGGLGLAGGRGSIRRIRAGGAVPGRLPRAAPDQGHVERLAPHLLVGGGLSPGEDPIHGRGELVLELGALGAHLLQLG